MNENDNIFNNDVNNGNNQNNFTQPDNNQMNNNVNQQNDSNQNPINYSVPNNEQPVDTQNQNNTGNETNQFSNYQPSVKISTETSIISGNNDNKKSKKGLKIVLIILVISLLAGAGFLFGPKLLGNKSNGSDSDENVKITGSVELIKEFEYDDGDKEVKLVDEFAEGPYYLYLNEKENKEYVLDKNGKSLIEIEPEDSYFANIYYMGDGYFAYYKYTGDKLSIYNINGYKKDFDLAIISSAFYYKNGILYISSDNEHGSIEAYDLKNDKQLWKTKITFYETNPYLLDNGILLVKSTRGDKDFILINSSTGEIIQTPECKNLYASLSAYYAIYSDKVDVYDYNNNLLYSINLGLIDGNYVVFGNVLNTGGVIIGKYPENEYKPNEYIVYNKSGQEIFRYGDSYDLSDGVSRMYKYADSWYLNNIDNGLILDSGSPKYSFISAEDDGYRPKGYVLFDDDTYYEFFDGFVSGDVALGYAEDDLDFDVKSNKIKIVDLKNKTENVLDEDLQNDMKAIDKSTNYYIIKVSYRVNSDYSYIVFDKDFKIIDKIKDNESVYPVNEDYYIKVAPGDNSKITLVNSNTKEENILDTIGDYSFNTENNLVTKDKKSNKQYLYKFK